MSTRPKAKKKTLKISDVDSAAAAGERLLAMQTELANLRQQTGIERLEQRIDEYKTKLRDFCVEAEEETINLQGGRYVRLVQSASERRIIGTTEELNAISDSEGQPTGMKSLMRILQEKFPTDKRWVEIWRRATKPIPDISAIEQLVSEGILSVEDLQPAYYEKKKSPYIRIFG